MLFGHVVQDDQSVLGLLCLHLLEIDVLNGEEHLRAYLAHCCSLPWDGLSMGFVGYFASSDAITLNA